MKRENETTTVVIVFLAVMFLLLPLAAQAGSLEPSGPPGPTMKTLDEIPPTWSQKLPVAQRFVIVLDGDAVLDKETGLVWEKSPDPTTRTWAAAVSLSYQKTVGGRKGWRLPTIEELTSLIDTTQENPALPSGHPFLNVQSSDYWSSTELAGNPDYAWGVYLGTANLFTYVKTSSRCVWAVRGRQ